MTKAVVALVVLVLVAGAIFYFVSDPFKTKVDIQVEQATKWTPENINKDPVGYLTWAIGKSQQAADSLSARQIALAQQKSNNERLLKNDTKDLSAAGKLFDQFRTAYKNAATTGSWPTEVVGTQYEEEALKSRVIEFRTKIDSLRKNSEQRTALQKRIESNMQEVARRLDDAKSTKTDLSQKLELVKANQAIDDLDTLRADVDGLTGVADFLAGSESGASIDDLIEQQQSTISDAEFNDILNADL